MRKEKLHLLPALLVSADTDGSPVTYLVLSLRLAGLGGDRACRALIDEMRRDGLIQIARKPNGDGDQREKTVQLTESGWGMLRQFLERLSAVCQSARAAAPHSGAGRAAAR